VTDLTAHVETCICERRLFRKGQGVLVAVSGGLDSMVLLHVLQKLSKEHRWKLTVAHFNHQLRGVAADLDEDAARRAARKLRVPFVAGRGNVKVFARKNGISIEMAARRLRHDFLARTAEELKIPAIALAHHGDDQVELFLLRVLRGAGGSGLAGMKWRNASPSSSRIQLVRPLLDLPKTALQMYARENKISFSEDASNACFDIQRNRIRHELIPLLTEKYQPAIKTVIPRLMEVIGAEAEFVTETATRWLKSSQSSAFANLPVAVQRRVIHLQLTDRGLTPDFELVERLRLKPGLWLAVDVDCSVRRDASGVVHFRRLDSLEFNGLRRNFSLTEEEEIAFGGVKICCQITDDNGMGAAFEGRNIEYFDADKVGSAIWLRCWQPGDRFQPIGTASPRKLQDLFTNLKVPRNERRQRVVAATRSGELFWVEGLRVAEKFKLDSTTARRLKWAWQRLSGAPSS
jgi:tRNA(Ile)-lysidine synthase